jgi:hypothetical protein
MKTPPSPQIICPEVPAFDATDLDSVRAAFRSAEICVLRQAWRTEPEAGFAPARVRPGWRGDSLLVLAELEDADIFTRATAHNQRFWELGDTFEIFLRPVEQQSYAEFHVAPNNLRLQLRFADAEAVERARRTGAFENALIPGNVFQSQTWVQPENRRWFAFAEIPAASVSEKKTPLAGSKWMFSFSRYDYTRGRSEPVISSTSAHAKPNFHCQSEWGVMQFSAAGKK